MHRLFSDRQLCSIYEGPLSDYFVQAATFTGSVFVPMPMKQIRIVWVRMTPGFMTVPVGIWFAEGAVMGMLMVRVVGVAVLVFHRFVQIVMVVPFGRVQP